MALSSTRVVDGDFSWVRHSISTVTASYYDHSGGGFTISNAHYGGTVVEKDEGIFYSDRQITQDLKTRSLSYGLNLQVEKIGVDVKGGGLSLSVTVLGVNMYI